MFNVQKLSGWMNSDQSEFEKEKKIHIPSSNVMQTKIKSTKMKGPQPIK